MCEAEHLFILLRSIYTFCVCVNWLSMISPQFSIILASPLNIYYLKYLFIYFAVFDLSHSTKDLQFSMGPVGSSSLTRNQTQAPCIGSTES